MRVLPIIKGCIPAVVAVLLGACGNGDEHFALGTLERDLIRLTAPASEIITAVHVQEGDVVETGAPLLDLDDTAASAQVARAEADLSRARAYLQQLQNGARDEELASARARVENADATAIAAQKAWERTRAMVDKHLLGQAELDQALAQRDSSRAALADAREQLLLLEHGTRRELLEQAAAQVDEAQQSLAIAKKQVRDLHLYATRAGRVDTLPWKLGERVTAGSVLVVLIAADHPYVRAYAPESTRALLQPGTSLPVAIDGIEGTLTGTLVHVQQEPAFSPHYALTETERSRLMYLIKVSVEEGADNIPGGVPAQVILRDPASGAQ